MKKRNEISYRNVFDFLKANNFDLNLKNVIIDFELQLYTVKPLYIAKT